MTLDGESGALAHARFDDLPGLLQKGDRLVFNNTRVLPARAFAKKDTGGKVELLLERVTGVATALAKIRASKSPKAGQTLWLDTGEADTPATASTSQHNNKAALKVTGRDGEFYLLESLSEEGIVAQFEQYGQLPLPPYIERQPEQADMARYQTIYASEDGAVAAPTAGLHFTESLLQELAAAGIESSYVTLHVGAGTFQPVRVDDLSQHEMHTERFQINQQTVDEINGTRAAGGRVIAVGTTSVRTLESACRLTQASDLNPEMYSLAPCEDETSLFLKPGDPFHIVDGMITNFHLPESTLIMLVAAYAGTQNTLNAYREAVTQGYRFYSYGDAMLVWPDPSARGANVPVQNL